LAGASRRLTPWRATEEVWTKISNALAALSEHQANAAIRQERADTEMAELRQLNKASDERLDRHIEFVVKAMDRTDQLLAESARQIAATAAAQEATELQLQKFISKVDGVDDRVTKLEKKP
jgi:hypothetical protein